MDELKKYLQTLALSKYTILTKNPKVKEMVNPKPLPLNPKPDTDFTILTKHPTPRSKEMVHPKLETWNPGGHGHIHIQSQVHGPPAQDQDVASRHQGLATLSPECTPKFVPPNSRTRNPEAREPEP